MNVIGQEATAIFNTFELSETEKQDLNIIKTKFDERFAPKQNEAYAFWVFQTLHQGEQETFDEFLTKTRTLIKKCEYGNLENRILQDKIIAGIHNDAVREKLLAEPTLGLIKAVLICRNYEVAKKQMQKMKTEERKADVVSKAKQDNSNSSQEFKCRRYKNLELVRFLIKYVTSVRPEVILQMLQI